jgi:pilus assembly protein CpaF
MRPDRIIVGECRGGEVIEMLQAMNTGHEGSMTTIHANSPRDALARVELMVGLAGLEVAALSMRKLVAGSIQVIVQVARLAGGRRKIVKIAEITGMEGDTVSMHDLFEFVQTKIDADHVAQGYFRATGIRPKCLPKLTASGSGIGPETFTERRLSPAPGPEARR